MSGAVRELAPAPPAGLGALRVEMCTDEGQFAALGPSWERLYRNCGAATPFQSHAWLHSWWTSYGRRGRLRLVLVRDRRGGELRAAAPLMLTGHPLPRLVLLGGAITDCMDVLLDDEDADRAATALTEALWTAARTALIDLREIRPGGAAGHVYERWRGPRRRLTDSTCLELPARPMDELLDRMPSVAARRIHAKMRKLDRLGVEHRFLRYDEVASAVGTMLDLHRLQWLERRVTAEHVTPRFREHLTRSLVALVRSGEALVTEFKVDGEVLAVDVTVLSPDLAGTYLYGAHPRLRERKVDIAIMLMRTCADHVADGERQVLSLLRGVEPYKFRWRPDAVISQRLLLARRRTAPLLAVAAGEAAARDRAREWMRCRREHGGGT